MIRYLGVLAKHPCHTCDGFGRLVIRAMWVNCDICGTTGHVYLPVVFLRDRE
jgi:hypothetical protein